MPSSTRLMGSPQHALAPSHRRHFVVRFGVGGWLSLASLLVLSGCESIEAPATVADSVRWAEETPTLEGSAAASSAEVLHWSGWLGGISGGRTSSHSLELGDSAQRPVPWDAPGHSSWSVAIAGTGKSSPIVWDDLVFVTSDVGGTLTLSCHSLSTGEQLWSQGLQTLEGETHRRNGRASSTPATNGAIIVAASQNALHGVGIDGATRWTTPIPNQHHRWGAASSPLIFNEVVFHLADSSRDSSLGCYLLETGERLWSASLESDGGWSSPAPVLDDEGALDFVVINGTSHRSGHRGRVVAVDARTGSIRWSVPGTSDIPCSTAIISDALIVSSTGANGPILAIEKSTGSVAWRLHAGGAQVPTGLAIGERLFLLSDHGQLTCRDTASGKLLGEHRLQGRFSASLTASAAALYAVSEAGIVYALDPYAANLKLLSKLDLGEPCWATPAILPNAVVVRSQDHLWCFAVAPESRANGQRQESQAGLAGTGSDDHFTDRVRPADVFWRNDPSQVDDIDVDGKRKPKRLKRLKRLKRSLRRTWTARGPLATRPTSFCELA